MGKFFSKVGMDAPGVTKAVDHEFDYRYANIKKLRTSLKALIKSLHESNTATMNTPARMVEVGESYMSINACMNHAGAGGVSQSTNNRNAPSEANAHADEGEDLSPQPAFAGGGRTKINRELAKDTYHSAQAFSEAMRKLKEKDYSAYRAGVERDVIKKAEELMAKADDTLAIGKEAETMANKHATAAKKVDEIEAKCAKKGKEASTNKDYAMIVSARDTAEETATDKKNDFHESYEQLMSDTQEFAVQSMDHYIDLNVTYSKEFIRVIDASGSPNKGRSPAREESHEPH